MYPAVPALAVEAEAELLANLVAAWVSMDKVSMDHMTAVQGVFSTAQRPTEEAA
jgi:hypothetical protein